MVTNNTITQSGNLPPSINTDPTTAYFNTGFTAKSNTSSNINDALVGFFEEWTGSAESGLLLAGTILYAAQGQNINPMDLLIQFKELDNKQLHAYLTLFLNLNRVGTSLLGISNSPQVNKYIERVILP